MSDKKKKRNLEEILKKIPVVECGEKLVNLKNYSKNIIISLDPEIRKEEGIPEDVCYVRKGVAKRLLKAQRLLPKGYRLKIYEGYRTLLTQRKLFVSHYKMLRKKYPELDNKKIKEMTEKFVASAFKYPPHATGGAVDVTIVGPDNKELDMGTKVNETNKLSYTNSKRISKEARINRRLLVRVMRKAGFVNYYAEWWHWSYGDRYWAAICKKKRAIYGILNIDVKSIYEHKKVIKPKKYKRKRNKKLKRIKIMEENKKGIN
ncbi:MAG: M15 family metallopeptidase [Candidatus Woesearchaeota archaeon]